MSVITVRYAYSDYLALPDNGKRHEIIEGELFMTPAPGVFHQIILSNVEEILRKFVRTNNLGIVLVAPTDVILSDQDIVQPDLLFIASSRRSIITEKNINGAPDLIVEILSERTRVVDQKQKRQLYEKYGVKEYWMIDVEEKTVEILTLVQGRYASLGVIRDGYIRSQLLQGLEAALIDVFSTKPL